MRVYIVSDFHLSFSPQNEDEKQRSEKVVRFIDSLINHADILIMAGDIFDLWYDWGNTIIKGYFPLLKKLADLKEAGCRLIFIAGNHDFWFGDFLQSYLNCEVYQDNFEEIINNKKIFVSHGDLYTMNDRRYRIFRTILRHSITRFLFSILHPEIALKLGKMLSRTSRARNSIPEKQSNRRSLGLDRFAESLASTYDLIVLGHSHNPKRKELNGSIYVNTGDWVSNSSYLLMTDNKVELLQYKVD